jgi:hypothetical protein
MEISFISNVQKLGHKKYSILGCSSEKVDELVTCAFSLHLDNLTKAFLKSQTYQMKEIYPERNFSLFLIIILFPCRSSVPWAHGTRINAEVSKKLSIS